LDSFAVVLRQRSKGMLIDEYGRTVQLWLVAGGRSDAVVPLAPFRARLRRIP
jgi:hypothetical protein